MKNNEEINNRELIGYDEIYKKLIALYKKDVLPNKILLSGNRGIGKSLFAKCFINNILSNQMNGAAYNLIDDNILGLNKFANQNFFHIDIQSNKKFIEIDQIRDLILKSQKQSMNFLPRFILIDNTDKLNKNASNALLKILEEPYTNMYFILIHDNNKKILETVKSRCIVFNISFSFNETIEITNNILKKDIYNFVNNEFINNYCTVGELINLYQYSLNNKIDLKSISVKDLIQYLIDEKKYKNDNGILEIIIRLIEIFFYEKFFKSKDVKFYNFYKYFSKKYYECVKYNLDLETLFLDFKKKIIYE